MFFLVLATNQVVRILYRAVSIQRIFFEKESMGKSIWEIIAQLVSFCLVILSPLKTSHGLSEA